MKPFNKIKSFFNITIRISLFIVIGFLLPSVAKKDVVPSIEVFEELWNGRGTETGLETHGGH